MTVQPKGKLPQKEWWCGCDYDLEFATLESFFEHMKDKHSTWVKQELPRLLEKYL